MESAKDVLIREISGLLKGYYHRRDSYREDNIHDENLEKSIEVLEGLLNEFNKGEQK